MSKQTIAIIVGAIVLFAVAVISATVFSTGGDSGGPVMTMPDGSTMPTDQMSTGDTMTMEDGSTMSDEEMQP